MNNLSQHDKIEKFLVVRAIYELNNKSISQRSISDMLNISLGKVNKIIKECEKENLIKNYSLTIKGKNLLNKNKVNNAIILASGLGTRLAPLTYEIPKGLCTIFGEKMIERQIKQLNAVGITNIIIVVGYLKEKFEYLIDKYNVRLIYNPDYSTKNNLFSLALVKKYFKNKNSYILASDHWMRENVFHKFELNSWYAAKYFKGTTKEWGIKYNKDQKIIKVEKGAKNMYCMYGPAFFNKNFSISFYNKLFNYEHDAEARNYYWEDILINDIKNIPPIYINKFDDDIIYEFETIEEFRSFDKSYIDNTGSFALKYVSQSLKIKERDIKHIKPISAGMTNKSWVFTANMNNKTYTYICRSPGKGSNILINRKHERIVYELLKQYDITDEIVSIDDKNGYKITKYYNKYRKLDVNNNNDLKLYVDAYSNLHSKKIKVNFSFNLNEQIDFYDKLIKSQGIKIPFEDINESKKYVTKLINFVNRFKNKRPKFLIHVDSCVDNILVVGKKVRIIDWEYAAAGDPLLDIAMFSIYSYKDFNFAFKLLSYYLSSKNKEAVKQMYSGMELTELNNLLVAYMSLSAYLWTLWSIFKGIQGDDYGEYELNMYKIFKDNYRYLLSCNILI